jgi:arylsulfatase A-like enzyme
MTKPAILLITWDELRRDALSFYGNRAVSTPSLDALAKEGTVYDACYTPSPLCLPARSSILTGLYPHNSKAYSNFRDCPLGPEIPNLFNLLKQGGYRTAMAGKCHFAPVDYDGTRPGETIPTKLKAFYQSLGIGDLFLQDGKTGSVWFLDDYSREIIESGHMEEYRRLTWDKMNHGSVFPWPHAKEIHPDHWVGRKSIEFIDGYEDDAPLFYWASFSGPHYPFDAPAEYRPYVDVTQLGERSYFPGEFDDPSRIHHTSMYGPQGIDACSRVKDGACVNFTEDYWTELRIQYHATVKMLDIQAGLLIDAAKRKFGDDLMILFTTDHGELLGDHGLWGKNNCAYEPVWRVPMFVKYPNESAHDRFDCKVSTLDIMPTCLHTAGLPVPPNLDGRGFRLSERDGGRSYVFSEAEGFCAVTDGVHKYIHLQQGPKDLRELYDLSADPGEFHNYVSEASHKDILNTLRDAMIGHLLKDALP